MLILFLTFSPCFSLKKMKKSFVRKGGTRFPRRGGWDGGDQLPVGQAAGKLKKKIFEKLTQ